MRWLLLYALIMGQAALAQPAPEVIAFRPGSAVALRPAHDQMSCTHLRKRVAIDERSMNLMAELAKEGITEEIYSYLFQRTGHPVGLLLAEDAYKMEVLLSEAAQQAIANSELKAVSGVGFFEPADPWGRFHKVAYRELDAGESGTAVTLNVRPVDICFNGHVDLLQFRACPKVKPVFTDCQRDSTCVPEHVVNWWQCKEIQTVRIDLKPLAETMGRRSGVIKRGQP